MSSTPLVVIGVPLYNHEDFVRESMESLLTQSYGNFKIVAVDDCSTDATADIVRHYAEIDDRLVYVRNESRLGMIGNWRRSFEAAVERYPDAEYFAWASDHDLCHPRWLARLVAEFRGHPEAVLAYPIHLKVDAAGEAKGGGRWRFDTAGVNSRLGRFRRVTWSMSAGNMVYGLFRIVAFRKAGVFRRSLLPDRLLLAETSLHGEFRQAPEVLWYRRHEGNFSLARQRRSLFGDRRPWWSRVPWWISHPAALGWNLAIRGAGLPSVSRLMGLAAACAYLALSPTLHFARGVRRTQKRHIPRLLERVRG